MYQSMLYCYKRIPETGQFRKNRDLFLTVVEAGKSNIKKTASCEGLLAELSHGKGERESQTRFYNKPVLVIIDLCS